MNNNIPTGLPSEGVRRLREMLEEDLGSPEEVEALLPLVQRLKSESIPGRTSQATHRLIETLLPEMPQPRSKSWREALADWWPLLLLRAQVRVVRSEIWIASALVMVFGTLVTLTQRSPSASSASLPLIFIAPVATAMGVAYLYGPDVDRPFEILLSTPVSTRLILLARLTLVFGFDLVLALTGSVILSVLQPQLSLWLLIIAWLAPMTFLSALAFCLSVVSKESMLSGLACFVLWVVQAAHLPYIRPLDLMAVSARPWLLLAAALLGGVALWLAGSEERWIGAAR